MARSQGVADWGLQHQFSNVWEGFLPLPEGTAQRQRTYGNLQFPHWPFRRLALRCGCRLTRYPRACQKNLPGD